MAGHTGKHSKTAKDTQSFVLSVGREELLQFARSQTAVASGSPVEKNSVWAERSHSRLPEARQLWPQATCFKNSSCVFVYLPCQSKETFIHSWVAH